MTEKTYGMARVISQEKIEQDIVSLWLETEACQRARCGQFVNLYSNQNGRLLPRPISICETRGELVRLVYRTAGKGTEEFASMKKGEELELLGPLGNGFPILEKKAFLIGGGIGIPPLLGVAKAMKTESFAILGYRDSDLYLLEDFVPYCGVHAATEDGSFGVKGTVLDTLREKNLSAEVIYACGPKPMLKAVKEYAREAGIPAYISMEERMACGIGACLGCVCQTALKDEHSQVKNRRVCKDGPVFLAEEVEL